jgi:hypothetical protein
MLVCVELPWAEKTESCLRTSAVPHLGQSGCAPLRTSSSKWDSHCMQTYS